MIELDVDQNGGIETEEEEEEYEDPVPTGYETADYHLVVNRNVNGIMAYQVVNTKFRLTEAEGYALYTCIDKMQELQMGLDQTTKNFKPSFLSLVGDEDEGEPSIH